MSLNQHGIVIHSLYVHEHRQGVQNVLLAHVQSTHVNRCLGLFDFTETRLLV